MSASGPSPTVSIVVPAYNESATIATSIRALLQLRYQHFEVIIVNDGSKDDTLAVMTREFQLRPFPEAYRVQIKTKPVRGVYRSLTHPNLRVRDKENGGGKADATNAGINAARHPIFYCGDADSVLNPHSLEHVVRPFLEDPRTVVQFAELQELLDQEEPCVYSDRRQEALPCFGPDMAETERGRAGGTRSVLRDTRQEQRPEVRRIAGSTGRSDELVR